MRKPRKNVRGALYHTYKISRGGNVLFYRRTDHLVYYTMQSVLSHKHRVRVLGTSHMFTHIHEGIYLEDVVQPSAYEHDLSSLFAREFNRECGRCGPLFAGHFGCAPKWSDKDKRACLIYIFNNPVEKRLVGKARDDRWNFLPYYDKEYPFSQRPVLRYCRKALLDAIHLVEHEYKAGRYLKYPLLHHLFSTLDGQEQEQLTDFIIQRYFFLDRRACEALFGDYDKMLKATELTTGKEFDVGETFEPDSDIPYREMCAIASRYGMLGAGLPLLRLPEDRQIRMARFLLQQTEATDRQVGRFLHYTGAAPL